MKKIISIILVVVIAMMCFAGCEMNGTYVDTQNTIKNAA